MAQMAVIFVASSQTDLPRLPAGLTDYTGHVIGYAILGVLALRAFAGAAWRGVTTAAAWRAVLLSSAYGATDELHQFWVPNRYPGLGDWVADTVGAVAGVLVVIGAARSLRPRDAGSRGV
jgi:VanZ family protein